MQLSKPAGTLCLILLALFVLSTGPFAWLLGSTESACDCYLYYIPTSALRQ